MDDINQNLLPDEKVVLKAHLHPIVFLPAPTAFVLSLVAYLFMVQYSTQAGSASQSLAYSLTAGVWLIFSGALFLTAVLLALQAVTLARTTGFILTNRRLIVRRGLVRHHTLELNLNKVESVGLRQSLLGRLFNFGTLTITGTGGTYEYFRPVCDPQDLRSTLSQLVEYYSNASTRA